MPRKIAMLEPRLVFAAAGVIADTSSDLPLGARFSSVAIAQSVVHNFRGSEFFKDQSRTLQIAREWGNQMAYRMRKGLVTKKGISTKKLDDWLPHQAQREGAVFVEGIFVGEEGGQLTAAVAKLQYAPARDGWTTPIVAPYVMVPGLTDEFTWIDAFGVPTVVNSYLYGNSEFSRLLDVEQRKPIARFDETIPIQLVNRAIDEDPVRIYPGGPKLVGGEANAVRLEVGKDAEWIAPPSCNETFHVSPKK